MDVFKTTFYPYYKRDNEILLLDDCLYVMENIQDDSIDLIFADPPYMLSNDGFSCKGGKMISVNKGKWDTSTGFENDLKFHENWINEAKRILKPNGTIWISGTYHNIYQCGFLLQKLGFHILNDIVWFKPNASPNLSGRFFTASHETLLWARKDKKAKHYFNYLAMKNGSFKEDKIKNPNMQMRSVWSLTTTPPSEKTYGKHPTQKPLNLLKRIILASSDKKSLILDPFNGSGTTALATAILGDGRQYIGIDNKKEFLDLTIDRLKGLEPDVNLLFK